MEVTTARVWSLYTQEADALLRCGMIALETHGAEDLSRLSADRDAFRSRFPDVVEANVLYRFAHELREGDFVLVRSGCGKGVDVARVTGGYTYADDAPAHRRNVRRVRRLEHGEISPGAMRELTYASASPLFEVKHYAEEILACLGLRVLSAPQGSTAAERFAARWSVRREPLRRAAG